MLTGSVLAALAWLAIGLAGLIPAGNAALARRVLFRSAQRSAWRSPLGARGVARPGDARAAARPA